MQRLEIRKFGPVKNFSLDMKDHIVFIGPQASGKSIISKSLFFFKSLRDDLMKYIYEGVNKKKFVNPLESYTKSIRKKFLDFWGPTFSLGGIHVFYSYQENVSLILTPDQEGKYLNPEFSEKFIEAFNRIIGEAKSFIQQKGNGKNGLLSSSELIGQESEKQAFFDKIQEEINGLFADKKDLFFIPAGRSLLSNLEDYLPHVPPQRLDYLLRNFNSRITSVKSLFNKSLEDLITDRKKLTDEEIDFKRVDLAKKLIQKVLKGTYRFENGEERLYFSQDEYTKISYASSGQQESVWILLMVFLFILEDKDVFILVEEPEAHLYPEAQKQIVELIVLLGNIRSNQMILTTHSPYILSSLSNLIYAGKLGQSGKEEVKDRIDPFLWLTIDNFSAYYIEKEGIRNILDEELRSIELEAIDRASSIINQDYDFLFNLED